MNADRRLSNLRRKLADDSIPAIIVTAIPNIRYLTGFENVFDDGANVACLVTEEVARVYTDFRYKEAAIEAAQGTPWTVHVPVESLYIELCDELGNEGLEAVTVESSVPYGRFRFISERFGGQVEIVGQLIEGLRQVKEAAEVERIAQAAVLGDRAFAHMLTRIAVGARECDIALELEVYLRSHGSEGVAFAPIVASGLNSSRPHASITDRAIEPGDFVTLDFGARVLGYCSDMTRTVVVGQASDRQREVYEAVAAAQQEGLAAARGGVRGADIDAAARAVLESRGLAEHFGHGLGHGVGLEVHELPSVAPRGRESVLSGSVITIEPGVYIPGFGGVRIEDLVVIEDGGCRLLSGAPRELLEI
ncbi:MAG: Xaa-Pro peptidase family protein [Coriobacteriia bacterium]|nr:Xaa-Pro peptidase family protein [Coriobacteriia bacterium]